METRCHMLQEALAEVAGQLDRLPEALREHAGECPDCGRVVAAEQQLARILGDALPPPDDEFADRVRAALPPRPVRWRVFQVLPVAASLLMTLVGALLVGGVPGASLVTLLPRWSARGWLALGEAGVDWWVALASVARAVSAEMPVAVAVGAAGLGLLGLLGFGLAARRWRWSGAWDRSE